MMDPEKIGDEDDNKCANCCQILSTQPPHVVCKIEDADDEDGSDDNNDSVTINYSMRQQTLRGEDENFFLELPSNNKDIRPLSPSSSSSSTSQLSKNVKVIDVLSSLYKLDDYSTILSQSHDDGDGDNHQEITQKSQARIGLCRHCSVMLTELYIMYEEFNKIRHQESYLHKEILKFKKVIDQCAKIVKDQRLNLNPSELEPVVPTPTMKSPSKKRKTNQQQPVTKKSTENKNNDKKKKKSPGKKIQAKSSKQKQQQQPESEFDLSDSEAPSNPDDFHDDHAGSDFDPTIIENDQNVPRRSRRNRGAKTKTKLWVKRPTKRIIISDDEEVDQVSDDGDIGDDDDDEEENQLTNCPVCEKDMKSSNALKNHMQSAHPPPLSFLCSDCGLRFSTKRNLKLHTSRRHQLVKRHPCDQCEKGFFSKRELDLHIANRHKTEKSFKCDICEKCFASAIVLKQHSRRHDVAQRSFLCSECGSSFFLRSDLERHSLLVHQDERKFECKVCSRAFKLDQHRKRHEETHLGKCKVCPICSATFTARMIKKHVQSHSKPPPPDRASGRKGGRSKASSSLSIGSPGMTLTNYVSDQLGLDGVAPFHNFSSTGVAAAAATRRY